MRVAQRYGTDNLFLVFADTGIEDQDNYRFLKESAEVVGGQLVWLKNEKTPWDVLMDGRWLSHRQGKKGCSYVLKVKPCRDWIESQEFTPENTVLYFGIGFEEIERLGAIQKNWEPFKVEAPLCWDDFGWADRTTIMAELKKHGLKRPRLYDMGFAHANCGGFCPKAGLGHYRLLHNQMPDRYLHHEKKEQEFLALVGRDDIGIVRKTKDGITKGLTLRQWRQQIESEPKQLEIFGEAQGGCNCFTDDD
jgi:hypothetical protein